ncbi:MAG: hypothetical protein KTR24_10485 [Saprospiraceae bacterium]|nr:hypothetical protein [Saprospiraceae bacterium]
MKTVLLLCIASVFWANLCEGQGSASSYHVVYEADRHGNRISGDLDQLIDHVENGCPIRVGWELETLWPDTMVLLSHWTDGGFITLSRGQVFAQIRGIFGQGSAHISAPPGVFLSSNQPNSWVAVVGTDGVLRSKFHLDDWMKELSPEELKSMETMKVRTKWAVPVHE